jgi:peptidoglycan/xylan/chitin deacetylase (PgdA/CDA1 family)
MYHSVTRDPLPVPYWCQLRAELFEEQVRFLAEQYRVLPLAEVVTRLACGLALPECTAVITFDDGYRDFRTTAYPILRKYQVPAVVFVVTGLCETGLPPWNGRLLHALAYTFRESLRFGDVAMPLKEADGRYAVYETIVDSLKALAPRQREQQLADTIGALPLRGHPDESHSSLSTMRWEEIIEVGSDPLVSVGSHTHTHAPLASCSQDNQAEELRTSRNLLRERLGTCDLFCYPFGYPSDVTTHLVAEAGYSCGLDTAPGLNHPGADPYRLRRVGVGADTPIGEFELLMLGW